ncbi:ATP-binding cassette domain-containing protein [Allorhizocola rhizosphaerae]|uniref:ATP-binding cassette domain-containing protein n=1 Tax=Allorhizocola rhizosphaerae TaxID=1872709 RepID=UPI00319E042E
MFLSHYVNESKAGAARIAELLAIDPLPEPQQPRLPADGSIRPSTCDRRAGAGGRQSRAGTRFIVGELPHGYDTRVGERGALLSGGQRQRVTIARAALSDARIIVLDEATAFADPENEAAIQDAIAALTRGRTVVVIAHRLSSVVDADQVVVLDGGRVAERGTHQKLLENGGRYAALWANHERARAWGIGAAR